MVEKNHGYLVGSHFNGFNPMGNGFTLKKKNHYPLGNHCETWLALCYYGYPSSKKMVTSNQL
jgi:hypothetical protein